MNPGRMAALLVVIAASGALAPAGEIYGKVVEDGKPVGEAASLEVKCGAKAYPAKTDKSGSYRVVVAESGKCSMSVTYKGQSGGIEIASYDEAAQIDLALDL